jgi:hypothetical protein
MSISVKRLLSTKQEGMSKSPVISTDSTTAFMENARIRPGFTTGVPFDSNPSPLSTFLQPANRRGDGFRRTHDEQFN